MIVRTVDDLKGTKRDMRTRNWSSLRFLHREDGMGFTLTDTVLEAGMDQVIWYKNHLEACYCLEGEGTIEELSSGAVYELKPGTLYALNNHDRHRLRVRMRTHLICVFNPALVGGEVHDAEGSYPSA
ncbi:MAG: ectoine synthase [Candidatus Rokubacteria bacterium]|nr:ectoine synthase [Candidatus Rokubacteria bacterium]